MIDNPTGCGSSLTGWRQAGISQNMNPSSFTQIRAEHKLLRLKPQFRYFRSLFNSNLSFHCCYLFVVFLFTILPIRIQTETLVILAQHWGLIGIGEISLFLSFVTNVSSSRNSAWHMVDMQQIPIDWRGSWSSWMLTFILEEPGILGAKVILWVYVFLNSMIFRDISKILFSWKIYLLIEQKMSEV